MKRRRRQIGRSPMCPEERSFWTVFLGAALGSVVAVSLGVLLARSIPAE